MLTLSGRTCVYAGATGMIGRGAVKQLAEGGMNVVMVTHNPDSAKEICEELAGLPGKVVAMSNANGDGAVFEEIEAMFGSVDVIINSVGGFDAVQPVEEISIDKLKMKLNLQVASAFEMVQRAVPYLKKSKAGRVIFMSSAGALNGFKGENIADSIVRGGIVSMAYALSTALASDGITVNCIAKSGIINDHEPHRPDNYDVNSIADQIPVGHIGTNTEFGATVAYLASEEAAFVTGHVMNLTGGLYVG